MPGTMQQMGKLLDLAQRGMDLIGRRAEQAVGQVIGVLRAKKSCTTVKRCSGESWSSVQYAASWLTAILSLENAATRATVYQLGGKYSFTNSP